MKKPNSFPKIIALLKLAKQIEARNSQAQAIIDGCGMATGITWSAGLLVNAQAARKAYDQSVADAKARIPGAVTIRDKNWNKLYLLLQQLLAEGQIYGDTNPTLATEFYNTCKFAIRTFGGRRELTFKAVNGKVSGEIMLSGETEKGVKAHEWEMADDAIHFTALSGTTKAKTTVSGLPVATKKYFRHRWLKKTGYSSWSQIIEIIVI